MIRQIFPEDLQKNSTFESYISFSSKSFGTIEMDSRDISDPTNALFVCLVGQKSNGHQYIEELIKKGVKSFLISDKSYVSDKANFYWCPQTVLGFQAIATLNRSLYNKPVLAITGSNGKTIVKEWLAQLLSVQFLVCKSPKSFNSQVGVPYSVCTLSNQDCAIFETGISQKGEMKSLAKVINPTIGLFTNLGDAHDEGFVSQKEKLKEKLLLFQSVDKIIYCKEQKEVATEIEDSFSPKKLISWGENGKYKVAYKTHQDGVEILVDQSNYFTHLVDKASLENATHSIVTALEMGASPDSIRYGLSLLQTVDMRFELKEGANNNLILNDSYNNDLSGLKMTLDLAKKLNRNQQILLIGSDFVHQDFEHQEWRNELVKLLEDKEIGQILWVGKALLNFKHSEKTKVFVSTQELLKYLDKTSLQDTFFIIKGARQYAFEEVVDRLELKQHITRIEVNLSRLLQNYNYYKSLLSPETKIMVMVKAFAYGTGIVEVSKLLEINQVDYLAVAYTDEGVLLRQHGIKKPIMVMNVVLEDYENLVKYDLEPEIYSLEQLIFFTQRKANLSYHLKLDTGMHRLGFDSSTFKDLIDFLSKNKEVKIASVLTHLAASDEIQHDDYTQLQNEKFLSFTSQLESVLGYKLTKHILNSAGIENFPQFQYDMVRLGIGIYGFGAKENTPLKQVISLKTNISQIRFLSKEETIGYGRKGKILRDSRIATIPIGYADGYDRRFSNGVGAVLINGVEVPVIGNVCMDMTMVDVTDLKCKAGDEVIVYNDKLSADKMAKRIGTISYELLTHLSERVRRIFYFD